MRNTLHRVGYCSDGLLTSRTAFTRDPAGHLLEVATYTADGVLVSRESHAREYDSHGNWIKETVSKWKSDSSEFEPVLLTYRKIAYRD